MSRTQFSLRTLLAAIAAVGIGAALWVAEPSWQVGMIEALFVVSVVAAAVRVAIHSKGTAHVWWVAIAVDCTLAAPFCYVFFYPLASYVPTYTPPFYDNPFNPLLVFAFMLSMVFRHVLAAWALAPVVGLLCVFSHWLLIRPPQGPQD